MEKEQGTFSTSEMGRVHQRLKGQCMMPKTSNGSTRENQNKAINLDALIDSIKHFIV